MHFRVKRFCAWIVISNITRNMLMYIYSHSGIVERMTYQMIHHFFMNISITSYSGQMQSEQKLAQLVLPPYFPFQEGYFLAKDITFYSSRTRVL